MKSLQLIVNSRYHIRSLFALGCVLLAGCAGQGLFRNQPPPSPVSPPPGGEVPGAIVHPASGYSLSAFASGQCINMELTNNSATQLAISPSYFALIPRGT